MPVTTKPRNSKEGELTKSTRNAEGTVFIDSVERAIQVVCDPKKRDLESIYDDKEVKRQELQFPYPFGLWFRGQSSTRYKLKPSIFRPTPENGQHVWYDESMMIQHFRQRNPSYEQTYRIPFDLLCLLQHYHLPTRLLDWTEGILVALYFAVADEVHDDEDGNLFALNARRLNSLTRLHDAKEGYICGSESIDVTIRSALASARRVKDLSYLFQMNRSLDAIENINTDPDYKSSVMHRFKQWLSGESKSSLDDNPDLARLLQYPVAVFPNRLNPRMTSQLSMVTLFGGKVGDPSPPKSSRPEEQPLSWLLREVCDLDELNSQQGTGKKFLLPFTIPKAAKKKVRDQLKRVGMHEAALFPELDHVGNYVRKEWTFVRKVGA